MDPFIDATKKVGPPSFGVLRIRNVSSRTGRKGGGPVSILLI
jgi:hypothetical protein